MTTAVHHPRRRRSGVPVALTLLALALTGCDVVSERARTQLDERVPAAGRAADCAALARAAARLRLDGGGSAAQAGEAVEQIRDRVAQVDDPEVREAGEALAGRAQELRDALARGSAQEVRAAADRTRAAAGELASRCGLPLDRVLG